MRDQATNPDRTAAGFLENTVCGTVLKAKAGEELAKQAAIEKPLARCRQSISAEVSPTFNSEEDWRNELNYPTELLGH
jgi:hypothetical protein